MKNQRKSPALLSLTFVFTMLIFILKTMQVMATEVPQDVFLAESESSIIRLTIGETHYTVNGVARQRDVAPFIQDGRTMVPLALIAEALGATTDWDGNTQTVTIGQDGQNISLVIGESLPNNMGTPIIRDGRTFVPVAYIAQELGSQTRWDGNAQAVYIQRGINVADIITPTPVISRRHGEARVQTFAYHLEDLQPPAIDNVNVEVLNFVSGIYRITISVNDVTLDPRATEPFFFWGSQYGTFSEIIDYMEDWASFVFSANPGTYNRNITLMVGVGDGLGQIERRGVVLKGNDMPGYVPAPPPESVYQPDWVAELEQETFRLINIERVNKGIEPLIWHDELARVTRLHSEDLARNMGALTNFGSDGSTDESRKSRAGIEWSQRNALFLMEVGIDDAEELASRLGRMRTGNRVSCVFNPYLTHTGIGIFYYPENRHRIFIYQKLIALPFTL